MVITDESYFTLLRNKVIVYNYEEGKERTESVNTYVDNPDVRSVMRDLVRCLVREKSGLLFDDVCTMCGSCCDRRIVQVTAKEIGEISRHLGCGENELREIYIEPGNTWNEADGILKKKNGTCAFLMKSKTRSRRCRIYARRPAVCVAFTPDGDLCRKEPGKLIYQIARMYLSGNRLIVETETGKSVEFSTQEPPVDLHIRRLKAALAAIPEKEPVPIEQVITEAYAKLEAIRHHVATHGLTPDFFRIVQEVTELTNGLDVENEKYKRNISILTEKVLKLMELIKEGEEDKWLSEHLSLYPDRAQARWSQGELIRQVTVEYRKDEELVSLVRKLVNLLTCSGDPQIWEAIWHIDADCFMCGECCRCLKVEINPYDIERIADHFQMSEVEIWEKYLFPGIFSWNDEDGIMAKKDGVRLDRNMSSAPCVFLEDRSDKVSLCSIYESRPDVCKYYVAKNKPCIETSVLREREGFLENIIEIEGASGVLQVHTRQSRAMGRPPLLIYLREDPDMKSLYQAIEKRILAATGAKV